MPTAISQLKTVMSGKKKNLNLAQNQITELSKFSQQDELNSAITETLKQFIFTFNEKKILSEKKKYGNLTLIVKTFKKCYLGNQKKLVEMKS